MENKSKTFTTKHQRYPSADVMWNDGSVQYFSNLAPVPGRNRSIKFRSLMELTPFISKIITKNGEADSKDVSFLMLLARKLLLEIIKKNPTVTDIKKKLGDLLSCFWETTARKMCHTEHIIT